MAGPITWRNVGGGGDQGSGALLNSGGGLVMQGLRSLQNLAVDQQRLNVQNQQAIRTNNTQDYLDKVAAVQDAGQLADPAVQAELEATRLGYGNLIDRAATRGAADAQLAQLQRQEVAANQFSDMETERAQRPLQEQLFTAARSGDRDTVKQLLDSNTFLNEGKLAADVDGVFDAGTRRLYAAEDQARQGRQEVRNEQQFRESMAAAGENRTIRREQIADMRNERAMKRGVAAIDGALTEVTQRATLAQAQNPGGKESVDPAKDTSIFMEKLASTTSPWLRGDNNARIQTQSKIQSLLTDGIQVPLGEGKDAKVERIRITPAQIQQYIDIHGDDTNIVSIPGSEGGSIDTYFQEMYARNPELAQKALQTKEAVHNLRSVERELRQKRRELQGGGIDLDSLSGTLTARVPKASGPLLPDRDQDVE